jgi:predicted transcriptional regulator
MRKEDIRCIYDGSIFYRKAEEHQAKTASIKQQRKEMIVGLGCEVKELL